MNTIHHIAIICSDKEAALHFYHDILGFSIIRENYREVNCKVKFLTA